MTQDDFEAFKECLKRGERVVVSRQVTEAGIIWTFQLPDRQVVLAVYKWERESVFLYKRPQTYLKLFWENGYESLSQQDLNHMIYEKVAL